MASEEHHSRKNSAGYRLSARVAQKRYGYCSPVASTAIFLRIRDLIEEDISQVSPLGVTRVPSNEVIAACGLYLEESAV